MAHSPARSPRLPSPPPMAEDQIGPPSPSANMMEDYSKIGPGTTADQGASRRIRPGTRSEDMLEGPPLVDLQDIDSAFQLTEHLKALHASHTHPQNTPGTTLPIDRATAQSLAQPPPSIDRGIWLYELCRFLVQRANAMAVGLFADDPPCSSQTCPEMRASEWQYLCAAHEPPKSCCAIDYCCHTLDWSATQLTSSKLFPSRLALGTESATSGQQVRKMTEIFRRVYRIFAHAWFQHREIFWRVENKTGLYIFFKTVCDEYRLIPEDNYTIPPEAEGIDTTPVADQSGLASVMKRDIVGARPGNGDIELAGNVTQATGNTTKRHRHGMGDRNSSVSTIIHEEVEEEEDGEAGEPPDYEESERGLVREVVPESSVALEEEGPSATPEIAGHTQEQHAETSATTEAAQSEIPHFPAPGVDAESSPSDLPPVYEPSSEPVNAFEGVEAATAEPSAESEPVVGPMNPTEAAAGDAEEASNTVAD